MKAVGRYWEIKRSLGICILLVSTVLQSCGVEDTELKRRVEKEFYKPYPNISIIVLNKIVTLTGTIDTEEEKETIACLTKRIKHVRAVTNRINIKAAKPIIVKTPENILTKALSSALNTAGYTTIKVAMADNAVVLTGNAREIDTQKIMLIINEATTQQVVNKLFIE